MSKFCSNCGKKLSDNSKFCDNCGNQTDNFSIEERKNKKSKKKKIAIIIAGIVLIPLIICIIYTCVQRQEIESLEKKIKLSDDYNYIDMKMEDFATVLSYELAMFDVPVTSSTKYNGESWADSYRYDIELENGETIYLSSNKLNVIERIIIRGNPRDNSNYTGKVVGTITKLLVPTTTESDLDDINKNFLSEENMSEMFGEDYIYNHIKYEWFWDKVNNDWYDITISPTE